MDGNANAPYWEGRLKMDDDGNEIIEPVNLLVDEAGNPTDLQEVTGYEVAEPAPVQRGDTTTEYPEDWAKINTDRKASRGWRCELCGFEAPGSAAIQVHHVDHDKTNNGAANLQVLCLTCHQSKHGSGTGMGEHVSAFDRDALSAWHRSPESRRRLKDEPMK